MFSAGLRTRCTRIVPYHAHHHYRCAIQQPQGAIKLSHYYYSHYEKGEIVRIVQRACSNNAATIAMGGRFGNSRSATIGPSSQHCKGTRTNTTLATVHGGGTNDSSSSSSSFLTTAAAAAAATISLLATTGLENYNSCDCEKKKNESFDIQKIYDIDKVLGEGGRGAVYKAKRKSDDVPVALKVIDREFTNSREFEAEIKALGILSDPGHEHICRIFGKHKDDESYYLALEVIEGGELFEHLIQHGPFSEKDAAKFLKQHASAITYIHSKGIIHADLKPENLMMSSWDVSNATLKIVDFGSAVFTTKDKYNEQYFLLPGRKEDCFTGTPGYIPPEMYDPNHRSIAPASDMFATGVIMYILLTGTHPFDPKGLATDEEIQKAVENSKKDGYLKKYVFGKRTKHLSASCVDVIAKLLDPNPKSRMTSEEFNTHPWIQGSTASQTKLVDSDRKLQQFWQKRFRMAVLQKYATSTITAKGETTTTLSDQNLKQIFHAMDVDGSGNLNANDLKLAIGELVDEKNVQDVIKSIDFDKNGTIDLSEFIQVMRMYFEDGAGVAMYNRSRFRNAILNKFHATLMGIASTGEVPEKSLRKIFDSIDLNGDGHLQVSELQELFKSIQGVTKEQWFEWIDSLDSDLSGEISFDEFVTAMKKDHS